MDISKEYIKMRLAAIPDLGMGKPMGLSVNWYSAEVLVDDKGDWYYSTKDEAVQIERQDQLQEMLGYGLITLLSEFERWHKESKPIHNTMDGQMQLSMEQLWLSFVMKEKYQKVSNGENWIKEGYK